MKAFSFASSNAMVCSPVDRHEDARAKLRSRLIVGPAPARPQYAAMRTRLAIRRAAA
ncbi:MAG TPA: hypothetical protein VF308_16920 [Caldimonas sp.]